MIQLYPILIFRFLILVYLQAAVFNNFQLFGFVNPYVYVLFILALPFEISKTRALIMCFILGLSIDLFMNSWGIHAAACTISSFVRTYFLRLISPREGYENGTKPNVKYMGWSWYLPYALVLIFVHHFSLFYIEYFKFGGLFITFSRVFLSVLFTAALVLALQMALPRNTRN
jgi:hypothetical protein